MTFHIGCALLTNISADFLLIYIDKQTCKLKKINMCKMNNISQQKIEKIQEKIFQKYLHSEIDH